MSKPALFNTYRILIVRSNRLNEEEFQNISKELISYGIKPKNVQALDSTEILQEYEISRYSHVISNSADFEMFKVCKQLLKPVVNSQWVSDSIERGKTQVMNLYSADPKHILRDTVISCSESMKPGDRELIFEVCRVLGATTLTHLSPSTTHFIGFEADEEQLQLIARYNEVVSSKEQSIAVVYPDWLFSSFIESKKLKEDDYTIGKYLTAPNSSNGRRSTLLNDKIFYITETYRDLDPAAQKFITRIVEQLGGEVSTEISSSSSSSLNVASAGKEECYLCQYRSGNNYSTALAKMKDGIAVVGNIAWLLAVIHEEEWFDPLARSLLHYPFPRSPLPHMEQYVISLTNYTGDSRSYIEKLITLLGAKFTRTLGPTNTHLITPSLIGRKILAKERWKFKVVNHLWIEESFSEWKIQDEALDKYNVFINDTTEDQEILLNTTRLKASLISDARSMQSQPTQLTQTLNSVSQMKGDEAMIVIENEEKTGDEYLNEQANTSKRSELDNGEGGNAIPLSLSSSPIKRQKTGKSSQDLTSITSTPMAGATEIPNSNGKPYDIIAVITGYDSDIAKSDHRILNKLGIKLIEQPIPEMNCIIAPTILRTEKFLKSLSMGLDYILTPLFISDVLGTMDSYHNKVQEFNNYKPDLKRYALSNTIDFKSESKKMKELFLNPDLGKVNVLNLITQSQLKKGKLFESINFNISSEITGTPEVIGGILRAFGCEYCNVLDATSANGKDKLNLPELKGSDTFYLICSPDDKKLISSFKKTVNGAKYRIVEWTWVVRCVFNMEVMESTNANRKRYIIQESK